MYGPYQMQGDQLMKSLNKKFNFKTYWMMRGNNVHDIPPGVYTGRQIPLGTTSGTENAARLGHFPFTVSRIAT